MASRSCVSVLLVQLTASCPAWELWLPDWSSLTEQEARAVLHRATPGAAPRECPALVLHHAPGSSFLYDDLVLALGNAFAPDLPGNGESEPGEQSVDAWTSAVQKLVERMKVQDLRIYGHNGGAAVAVELAHRLGKRVRGVVLDAPAFIEDKQLAA